MNWDDLMLEKDYGAISAYNQSKLANVLFTKELQKRVNESQVKVVALHPGVIKTEMGREYADKWHWRVLISIFSLFQSSPLEGAQTSLLCALEDFDKLKAGAYYSDCKVVEEGAHARKEQDMKRLWEVSEKLIEEKIKSF